ncbi:MAG: hypothetical protein ASARMPREDX12_004421 [Alectoria sarmentosa]|nr:MAG: hypothetical protein ASARMPREDX12_004421 [Alectoria sarmentosa]
MFVGAAIGDLGRHTNVTPDGMPIFNRRMEVLFKIIYISQLTQTVAFGLTKVAVVLFYRRIFTVRTFSIISWVMIGLTITWTIAFFAANLLQCSPISYNWASLDATSGTCIHTTMMYLAQAWSDVFTDILILSMPLPWIWRLQMARMRKFLLFLMFQLGALVVGAGVAKLVVFHKIAIDVAEGDADVTYLLTPTVYWPMVESSLGIVGACLPLLRPIFTDTPAKDTFSSLRAMMSLSSLRSNNSKIPFQGYDELESGGIQAPQKHLIDGV